MPARKNIIKDLRQEIKALEDKIKGQYQHINYREKQFARIRNDHERELAMINTQTNNLANILKYRFNKELTWMELCDDPDSKFQLIRRVIDDLMTTAEPARKYNER